MRLMRFDVPGKQLVAVDTLSRHPLEGQESDTVDQVRAYVNTAVTSKPIRPPKMKEIHRATKNDAALKKSDHVLSRRVA